MVETNPLATLVPGRPFVLGVSNQPQSFCGVGLCDPLLAQSVSGLEPFRYHRGAFSFALAADGGDLTIAAGTEIKLFTSGVGELATDAGYWFSQTTSDTDLLKSGAPTDRPYFFMVCGIAATVEAPHQRGGTGAAATDPRKYLAWMLPEFGYTQGLIQAIMNGVAVSLKFGDTGCEFRAGILALLPQWGGAAGGPVVRNGVVATPGQYLPTNAAFVIGPRDDSRQLTVKLAMGQAATIGNNGISPTLKTGVNTGDIGTVYVPVLIVLPGYMVLPPGATMAAVNGLQVPG